MSSINPESSLLSLEKILETISEITLQIQQRRELKEILQWTLDDARSLLQADRVLICCFPTKEDAVITVESVGAEWATMLGQRIYAPHVQDTWVQQYCQDQSKTFLDIDPESLPAGYVKLLEQLQVQPSWVIPILNQDNLWGLLIVHHCCNLRQWNTLEVQYLQQVARLLSIAVQQEDLWHSNQQQFTELEQSPDVGDLTDRQWAETTLQEREYYYAQVLDSVQEMVFCKAPGSIVTYANRATCQYYGMSLEQLRGITDVPFNQLDFTQQYIQDDLHVFTTGEVIHRLEEPNQRSDGEVRYFHTIKSPIFDADGNINQIVGVSRDITERKHTEERLQDLSHRLKLAVESARLGVWDWDILHDRLIWDDRTHELYGIQPTDFDGTYATWEACIHPEDRLACQAAIQQILAGAPENRIEFRVILPNGTLRYLESYALILRNPDGEPIRMIGVDLDISDRHVAMERERLLMENLELQVQERTSQLQQALEFEALLKRITDQVRDSLDEEKILQQVVRELAIATKADCCDTALYSADRITTTIKCEYNRDGFQAKNSILTITSCSDPNLYIQLLQGHYCHFCLIGSNMIRLDQSRKAILACPITDDQGVIGDLWLFKPAEESFNDLEVRFVQQVANQCAIALRQSRLYQTAQAQVQELERLNHLKDDFLSTVSHELRSPMSNIKMATQMLEITLESLGMFANEENPINRYFKILQEEEEREINLINDLLDLARLEAGTEVTNLVAINLQHFIPHLAEPFIERTHDYQQTLEIDIAEDLPILTTNLDYLERIITELLHNACKYTPSWERIIVSAQVISGKVEIHISNSGIEIPVAEQNRIFEKFYRIPNNDHWKQGGTGLGLALVKKLVEALGGSIELQSVNNLTCFIVQLNLL